MKELWLHLWRPALFVEFLFCSQWKCCSRLWCRCVIENKQRRIRKSLQTKSLKHQYFVCLHQVVMRRLRLNTNNSSLLTELWKRCNVNLYNETAPGNRASLRASPWRQLKLCYNRFGQDLFYLISVSSCIHLIINIGSFQHLASSLCLQLHRCHFCNWLCCSFRTKERETMTNWCCCPSVIVSVGRQSMIIKHFKR